MEQNTLCSMISNEDKSVRITPERFKQMQSAVENFICNKMDNKTLLEVADAQIIFKIFKDLYCEKDLELKKLLEEKERQLFPSEVNLAIKDSKTSQVKFFTEYFHKNYGYLIKSQHLHFNHGTKIVQINL